ncbi:MAG: hypothetical protein SGPRY_014398 [Prymnesium sp.]
MRVLRAGTASLERADVRSTNLSLLLLDLSSLTNKLLTLEFLQFLYPISDLLLPQAHMCYVAPVAVRLRDVFQFRSDAGEPEAMCDRLEWRVLNSKQQQNLSGTLSLAKPSRNLRSTFSEPSRNLLRDFSERFPRCPAALSRLFVRGFSPPPTESSRLPCADRSERAFLLAFQMGWHESWAVLALDESGSDHLNSRWRLALYSTLQDVHPHTSLPVDSFVEISTWRGFRRTILLRRATALKGSESHALFHAKAYNPDQLEGFVSAPSTPLASYPLIKRQLQLLCSQPDATQQLKQIGARSLATSSSLHTLLIDELTRVFVRLVNPTHTSYCLLDLYMHRVPPHHPTPPNPATSNPFQPL